MIAIIKENKQPQYDNYYSVSDNNNDNNNSNNNNNNNNNNNKPKI